MNATAWVEDFKSVDGVARVLDQHGPKLLVGVLLAAIAVQCALLLTSQPGSGVLRSGASGAAKPPVPVRTPALEMAKILNAHLFGVAASASVASADAPRTSMPLVLAGVIAMPDPEQGMAIVGANAASAKLVNVGGTIDGGVKLHAVYGDRVLLDRGGAIEALFLPKTQGAATFTAPPPPVAAVAVPPGQRLQNLSQNNTLLNGLARVQAVFNQGKLAGYRVFPGGRSSISAFTQLGLQPGDLITSINGTALDDPNRGAEVLQTLSNAGSASVTVTRNGQPQELNLNLETVANAAEAAVAADTAAAIAGPAPGPGGMGSRGVPRNANGTRPGEAGHNAAEQ